MSRWSDWLIETTDEIMTAIKKYAPEDLAPINEYDGFTEDDAWGEAEEILLNEPNRVIDYLEYIAQGDEGINPLLSKIREFCRC